MRERLITEVEAIMIEQMGGIAPLDEETVRLMEKNGTKPKNPKQERVLYRRSERRIPRDGKK